MADDLELSNIFNNFHRLKNAGRKANLYMGCEVGGQVVVNLQAHFVPVHPHRQDEDPVIVATTEKITTDMQNPTYAAVISKNIHHINTITPPTRNLHLLIFVGV